MTEQATCYFPDGSTSPGSFPCWNSTASTDGYAPCCFNDAYCFSNGLCLDSNTMTVYRAGCTDQSWVSSNCANFCTGGNVGGLFKCDNAGNAGCFASDCGTSHQFLTPSGSLMRAGPAVTSALGLSDSAPSPSANQSTPVPSQASQPSGGISTGAAAGIGVGVGLPLLVLCGTFFWLFLKEKRRSRSSKNSQNHSPYTQPHNEQKVPPPQYPPVQDDPPVHEIGSGHGRAQLHGEPRAQLP